MVWDPEAEAEAFTLRSFPSVACHCVSPVVDKECLAGRLLTSVDREAPLGGCTWKGWRMATNRNVPYKLLHDARKRLKRRMVAESLSPQIVLGTFGEG